MRQSSARQSAVAALLGLSQDELALYLPATDAFTSNVAGTVNRDEADSDPAEHTDSSTVRCGVPKPKRMEARELPVSPIASAFNLPPIASGRLDGLKVGLKDNIAVRDQAMTLGSLVMQSYTAPLTATVVDQLRAHGGSITAKLAMDAFSHTGPGFGTGPGDLGRCDNPVLPGFVTGGSSSGSAAAVATQAVDVGIGGDQGGSVRIPAAWSGVLGLKPTRGLIPAFGTFGIHPLVDNIGPLSRTADHLRRTLTSLARVGQPLPAATHDVRPLAGLRVGVLLEGFGITGGSNYVDEAVRVFVARLEALGADVLPISVPRHRDCSHASSRLLMLLTGRLFADLVRRMQVPYIARELFHDVSARIQRAPPLLPPRVKLALMIVESMGPRATTEARSIRTSALSYRRAYDDALRAVDVLVMPTVPIPPPKYVPPRDKLEETARSIVRPRSSVIVHNVNPFNLTGHPALTIPCKETPGFPVGAMLVGRYAEDHRLIDIAAQYERWF